MFRRSHNIARIATAIALAASVAGSAQPALGFDGRSPDTRDAVGQASDRGKSQLVDRRSPDTREAAEQARSTPVLDGRSPDAREPVRPAHEPVASPALVLPDRFHWGDFAIGVGVAVSAILLLAGLAAGTLAARHRPGERTGAATT